MCYFFIYRYKNLNNTVATRAKNLHAAVHSLQSFDKSLDQVSFLENVSWQTRKYLKKFRYQTFGSAWMLIKFFPSLFQVPGMVEWSWIAQWNGRSNGKRNDKHFFLWWRETDEKVNEFSFYEFTDCRGRRDWIKSTNES